MQTPLREFLRTATGGAAVLLVAVVAALAWVNIDATSYESLWETRLSLQLADAGVSLSLRESVNSGVMTFFFFFVVRLEARREFDLGDLRERRRLAFARAGRNQRQVRERKGDHIQAGDAEGSSLSRGRSARSSVTPDPHSARQRV